MKIKIEGKTRPETPHKSVKYNGNQWANCSDAFYAKAQRGSEFDVEIEENEKGFKRIVEGGIMSKPTVNTVNGDPEKMTKADWQLKERFIARTAIMKSVLESPALAESLRLTEGGDVAGPAMFLFDQMWKKFNEVDK